MLLRTLTLTATMTWAMFWALMLGFMLSAVVQAVVSKKEMTRLLPDSRPITLLKACGLGAASSSCSYAAVALARSLFTRGANSTAAIAFELASTNLVAELGIILAVFLGWQFTLAELAGGPIMVLLMAVMFRLFLSKRLVAAAKRQAERGVAGKMEGHAGMQMAVTEGPLWHRMISPKGRTAISHYFVMDLAAVWFDILLGLVLAGVIGTLVPKSFWSGFFLSSHPLLAKLWGPLVGPVVSILSFVCSVGNVPLAAVLWKNGISFGGVISFLFADLLVLPILNIYRKYYGLKMTAFLLVSFYVAMVLASLVVEGVFGLLGLIPERHTARFAETSIRLNYTSVLDLLFLLLAGLLLLRFLRTGGPAMMRRMGQRPAEIEA